MEIPSSYWSELALAIGVIDNASAALALTVMIVVGYFSLKLLLRILVTEGSTGLPTIVGLLARWLS